MSSILEMIGRSQPLFAEDLAEHGNEIAEHVKASRFLVIGGAGSIGSEVVRQLFARDPKVLHVVDISENNLAELVRSIRSSAGYIDGDFRTFCFSCLENEFAAFEKTYNEYDYVLNFSALKHVRSEKDPFTLMRMIRTNVFGTVQSLKFAERCNAKKYFCVSTDKASNPVNMMGASKRIMEMFLLENVDTAVSSARFANVAFSDGSLPFSFHHRMQKRQPVVAPNDVRRYFVTAEEGAMLCLFSLFFGNNRDIFFPKLTPELNLETFKNLAIRYLDHHGYEPLECATEDEARAACAQPDFKGKWPCYFFPSDTTGEKDFEEFYTDSESVDWDRFKEMGVVQNKHYGSKEKLDDFAREITGMIESGEWAKTDLVRCFNDLLETFDHDEKHKYLDDKM